MRCPNCNEILSNAGESQDIRIGHRAVPYIDANGRPCKAYNRFVAGVNVAYECDGPRGCEASYIWSSQTRRMTLQKPPLVGAGDYKERGEE